MSNLLSTKVIIWEAKYSKDVRCFVFLVENKKNKNQFYTQIPEKSILTKITNLDDFTPEQMEECTKRFCVDIIGKEINLLSDPKIGES